jgi:hypothetical protein
VRRSRQWLLEAGDVRLPGANLEVEIALSVALCEHLRRRQEHDHHAAA